MKNIDDLGEKELKIISGALDFNKKKVSICFIYSGDSYSVKDRFKIEKYKGHNLKVIFKKNIITYKEDGSKNN